MTSDKMQELLNKLPAGRLRLVDHRVVAGDSNWLGQPLTITVINHKRTTEAQTDLMKVILEVVNQAKADAAVRDAAYRASLIAGESQP